MGRPGIKSICRVSLFTRWRLPGKETQAPGAPIRSELTLDVYIRNPLNARQPGRSRMARSGRPRQDANDSDVATEPILIGFLPGPA